MRPSCPPEKAIRPSFVPSTLVTAPACKTQHHALATDQTECSCEPLIEYQAAADAKHTVTAAIPEHAKQLGLSSSIQPMFKHSITAVHVSLLCAALDTAACLYVHTFALCMHLEHLMPDALQWFQCGHIKHMQPRGNPSQQMVSSRCQTEDPVIKGHYTCQGETAAVPYPDRVVPRSAVHAPAMRLIWAMYSVASLAGVKNGAHRYKGAEVSSKTCEQYSEHMASLHWQGFIMELTDAKMLR